MKKLLFLSLMLISYTTCLFSQTTYNPSCYSNAHGWTITKIERTQSRTLVYLNLYYHTTEKFFFHPSMYIENYNNQYDSKLYVTSAMDDKLNTWYTLNAETNYNFVLEFPAIPTYWTDINIKEPTQTSDYTAWYWDYISLNKSQDERLKIDRFFLNGAIKFLAGAAHPFDTYKFATYTVDYNNIKVTMYYNDGYYTYLTIKKSGNFLSFSRSDMVDYNCPVCSPFIGIHLLKQMALGKNNYQEYENQYERYLGKVLDDMNGCDLASLFLTLGWLDYN